MGHCPFVSLNCLETFQIYHSKVAPADGIPSSLESVRQECVMVLVLLLAASTISGRWCEGVLCHPSCCLFSVLGGSETVDAGVHVQSRWWRHQKPIQMWLGDLGRYSSGEYKWLENEWSAFCQVFLGHLFIRRVQLWRGSVVRRCNSWLLSAEFATFGSPRKDCLGGCLCLQAHTPL